MIVYYLVFTIILFSTLRYLWKKDPLYSLAFVTTYFVIVRFLFFKFAPEIAFASGSFLNYAIVLFFISKCIENPKIFISKSFVAIFISALLFFTYLILLAMYRGHNYIDYILFFRNNYFLFLLFILFLSERKPRYDPVLKHISIVVGLLIIQVILGLGQYIDLDISNYFTIMEYERLGLTQFKLSPSFMGRKMVTGTLMSMHNVSVFIYIFVVFLFMLISTNKLFHSEIYVRMILIFGIIVMVLSGIRAPILGLFITIGLWFWYRNKIKFSLIILSVVLLTPIFIEILAPLTESAFESFPESSYEI